MPTPNYDNWKLDANEYEFNLKYCETCEYCREEVNLAGDYYYADGCYYCEECTEEAREDHGYYDD